MKIVRTQVGASKIDVEQIVAKLERKLTRSGLVSTILGITISSIGTGVELLIKADYGFVFIAIGILGIGVGLTLWKS